MTNEEKVDRLVEVMRKYPIFFNLRDCSICNELFGFGSSTAGNIYLDTSCGCASSQPRQTTCDELKKYALRDIDQVEHVIAKYEGL